MKTLYIVRHAQAENLEEVKSDRDRALTKRGMKDAITMANRLARIGACPYVLISSPAKRALQTAKIFAHELDFKDEDILIHDAIYEDDLNGENLIEILHGINDVFDSAMIFGHDPLLSEFAHFLDKDFNESLPKGGVLCLEFNNQHWSKIGKGRGRRKFFARPDKNKKIRGQLVNDLKQKLAKQILSVLSEINADNAVAMNASIKQASADLADRFFRETIPSKPSPKKRLGRKA